MGKGFQMDSRRDVLKKLVFGATALPLGASATASALTANQQPAAVNVEWLEKTLAQNPEARQWLSKLAAMESAPAPWDMVSPLVAGSELALGWFVSDLSPVQLGGAVLTLEHKRGFHAQVHICRHTGSPKGITHSKHFDLFVMNGGDGERPSEEELGRVVLTIGEVIRQNESKRPELTTVADSMLTHDERLDLFGPESLLS